MERGRRSRLGGVRCGLGRSPGPDGENGDRKSALPLACTMSPGALGCGSTHAFAAPGVEDERDDHCGRVRPRTGSGFVSAKCQRVAEGRIVGPPFLRTHVRRVR